MHLEKALFTFKTTAILEKGWALDLCKILKPRGRAEQNSTRGTDVLRLLCLSYTPTGNCIHSRLSSIIKVAISNTMALIMIKSLLTIWNTPSPYSTKD